MYQGILPLHGGFHCLPRPWPLLPDPIIGRMFASGKQPSDLLASAAGWPEDGTITAGQPLAISVGRLFIPQREKRNKKRDGETVGKVHSRGLKLDRVTGQRVQRGERTL